MHFTTIEFAIFFFFILILNWGLARKGSLYRVFLLAANIIFYASLDVRFLSLLLAVGLTNWAAANLMAKNGLRMRKAVLVADLVVNLGLLAFFKYFEFFYELLESVFLYWGGDIALPPVEIIFPIGISFFTFQGVSYAIDVYRDPKQHFPRLLDVLLFVSFFPTVMSGPIMRAGTFIPQLAERIYDSRSFQAGFALIISGLFKKVVIASYLSEHIVRQVFQVPENYSSITVLAGVYSYSVQIYCDFSGYTDLAIGLALLMGFYIPDNFLQPYRAVNLQEFWHRWHISLSTWLRDYLYISLGGNRRGNKYLNLLITMILGGLWHGAHTRFILWGALHGLGLAVTHIYKDIKKKIYAKSGADVKEPGALGKIISWFLTFNFVSFLWVFFRAEDAGRAWEIFQAVFRFDQTGAGFDILVIPAIAVGVGINFFGKPLYNFYMGIQTRLPAVLQAVVIALLCIIIIKMGPEGVLPFIYFQF